MTNAAMSEDYPQHLYKYRAVTNTKELEKDYSIRGLFASEAVLSSRTVFNDLFDSKIAFVSPTPKQIKMLMHKSDKRTAAFLQAFIDKGKFTADGRDKLEEATKLLNEMIDSYRFYCLSANSKSNLMWSHYADCHRGFCIEFKSSQFRADKVNYQEEIPEIELIKVMGAFQVENSDIGEQIWRCLRTKLKEWEYEQEYRFQAGKAMIPLIVPVGDGNCGKMSYPPESVESVIFGCKTPENIKEFIREKLPFKTKFKQAIEQKGRIDIIDNF